MSQTFDLGRYMTAGVERVVKEALRASLTNPAESLFMTRFARAAKAASRKRAEADARGEHIPPFLIASITSQCNLHCAGCYARANAACVDAEPENQMTDEEWLRLFREGQELGVSFILLAGGEPLMRRDVLEAAGKVPGILFPVFTNGTLIGDDMLRLFASRRNLVPILSIEGRGEQTDARRGEGMYALLRNRMEALKGAGVIFGASVTVTRENLDEVTSDGFLDQLAQAGCKAVIYVEFVPVTEEAAHLAPGDEERAILTKRLLARRTRPDQDMVLISFPGDEKSSGGCLAAGRGFFHINARGGAEPCPFSPYSDTSVRDTSLREALSSPLFTALKEGGVLMEDHAGGCVLFERRDRVEALLRRS